MDNPRAEKVAVVTEVREHFQRSSAAILTEYRGLTVKDLAGLRRTLRDAGSEYKIYKNTLVRFAAADLGLDGLESLLVGPTAIAFVEGDASSVAKALREYARTNPKLTVKGGVLGTKIISVADTSALADLPPREVVLARIAGALAAPMQTFAGLLQAVPRSFAYGLKALIEKRGGVDAAASPDASPDVESAAPEAPAAAEPVAEAPASAVEPPVAAAAEPPVAAAAAEAPAAEPAAEAAPAAPAEPEVEVPEASAGTAAEDEAAEAVEEAVDEGAQADVEAATDAEESEAEGEGPPAAGAEVLSEQGEESAALDQVTSESDEDSEDEVSERSTAAFESEDTADDDDPAAPPYDDTAAPNDEEANIPAEVAAMSEIGDSEDNEPELPVVAVDPEDDAPPVDGEGD